MKKVLFLIFVISQLLLAKPKFALVIDDLGPQLGTYQNIFSLQEPVTLAIMPAMSQTKYLVKNIPSKNFEIIIHFPWEAISQKVNNYPIRITEQSGTADIQQMIQKALVENYRAVGINNHMGSKISGNKRILTVFMTELKKRQLFFLDSRTIHNSLAYKIAKQTGIKAAYNNVFLDTKNRQDHFDQMFDLAVKIAKKKGQVVAICHANRLSTVKRLPCLLKKYGQEVNFVHVSQLVK